MRDILLELCAAWPKRWDKNAATVCWMKLRTLPDTFLPDKRSPFKLHSGREAMNTLDTSAPYVYDAGFGRSRDAFIEQRKLMSRGVEQLLEK